MERMNFIMFCLGAGSLFVGMLIYPTIRKMMDWLKKLGKTKVIANNSQSQIDELKKQMNNLAEVLATRDKNRKYNTRKEVREYLEELRTKE